MMLFGNIFVWFIFTLSVQLTVRFLSVCVCVSQLINQSPLLANNPQLQDQMRTMMPQFLQQMQNPEVQAMMTNPQALNAIMQIQQGMEQLRTAAPGLVNSMGIPAPMPGAVPPSAMGTATAPAPAAGSALPNLNPSPANQALFSDFMSRMMNGMATGTGVGGAGGAQLPPEERFASQLEHLASMGFVNREANIQGECTPCIIECFHFTISETSCSPCICSSDRNVWRHQCGRRAIVGAQPTVAELTTPSCAGR